MNRQKITVDCGGNYISLPDIGHEVYASAFDLSAFSEKGLDKVSFDVSPKALTQYNPAIRAATEDEASISIYGVIGEDMWSETNNTAKRISGALASIGAKDVLINVNSPGGSMFEGLAIYSLLREHARKHNVKVTVNVLGIAASAASIIAMGGDERYVSRGGFIMIHRAWTVIAGNEGDFTRIAEDLREFDNAMASIYTHETGGDKDEIMRMMVDETYLSADKSIDTGFADGYLDDQQIIQSEANTGKIAASIVDTYLAKQGVSRKERRELLAKIKGTPSAADDSTPSAADAEFASMLAEFTNELKNLKVF